MKINKDIFFEKKKNHEPIVMATAYDYSMARFEEEAGVDVVLVGDSVGTNVLGYNSETEVTMADMIHHCKAVVRGLSQSYCIVDMPCGAAADPFKAFDNGQLLIGAGAECVKIEGWGENKQVIEYLCGKGIDVCGHIGYNPQTHGPKAKVFGKDEAQARALIKSAQIIQDAGAMMIVVEKVPSEVASLITEKCSIPIIGIGSGNGCDGQVLVVNDILGYGEKTFRHAKKYMDFRSEASGAIRNYCSEVRSRFFPGEANCVHIDESEMKRALI
ncbi:MAG TPA: 3-methyl-2-oxobutanoate hydroxymethyltransferase [Chitinispirillaceae bacterium]|nr:3-methyl-2-oxobutanoate hydroxymethyltransferase [Chitinispirillaceae bacterium]